MTQTERVKRIKAIESIRGSMVIAYITSTRQNLEVQMAMDSVRMVYEHLRQYVRDHRVNPTKIDLFLMSNGGDGTTPWRLVTLLREYTEHLSVIIPYRAFSAATLTALGADEIVMHPMGMLGPTDPTVQNGFNPQDPQNPQQKIGISVEDVTAFFSLIREDAGINHEDELVQSVNMLCSQVHPLALGNVKRSISQSRLMAKKLLSLHMKDADSQHKIDEIVDNLTSKSYYHGHPINRNEASEHIHIPTIVKPDQNLEDAIWSLYQAYEETAQMEQPFDPAIEFQASFPALTPGQSTVTDQRIAELAFIESALCSDVFSIEYKLSGQMLPNNAVNVAFLQLRRGWRSTPIEKPETETKN